MNFDGYKLPILQKRKLTEGDVLAEEIIKYFSHVKYHDTEKKKERRIDYCYIKGAIKQIGVRDLNDLFLTMKKFDGKYPLELKKNWLKKQIKESKRTLIWHSDTPQKKNLKN